MIGAVVMAAGRSTRFGSDKRIHRLANGRMMLAQSVINALSSQNYQQIAIVLPQTDRELFAQVCEQVLSAGLTVDNLTPLYLTEPTLFGDNLAAAFTYLLKNPAWQPINYCAVILADMPYIQPETHALLCDTVTKNKPACARPVFESNQQGHPVFFAKALWSELSQLTGEQGGKAIIQQHGCKKIVVRDGGVVRDLDYKK